MSDATPPWESTNPTPPWESVKSEEKSTSSEDMSYGAGTGYTRGGLPFESTQEPLSPQHFLDAAMLIPAAGVEAGALKGASMLENAATRAYPKVAQGLAEGNVLPFLSGATKAGAAGAAGGATYGLGTGRDVGSSAAIGAGGALVGQGVGAAIPAVKSYLGKELSQATVDLQKAAKAAGLDITGKTPEEINTQIQDWFKGKTESLAGNVSEGTAKSEVWPLGKSFAISKNYDKADAAVTKSYDVARKIGTDQHVDAEPVAAGLKSVIDDMKSKAAENIHDPKFASTLAKFERLYAEIAEGKPSSAILDAEGKPLKTAVPNTVTANKLVEIQQELNKRYVAAPERTSQDTPYSKLSRVIQNAVKNTSPEFQTAIKKANTEWTEFSNTYRDNKVLNQFWTPEDHDAFKALTERNIAIPAETQKRVYKMLDKIKTPADLEALKLAMKDYPKEYDSIRAAKFYEIMDKSGIDAKAIDKNYDVLVKSLENDPKSLQTLDAIKTLTEQLNQRGIGDISPVAAAQRDSLIARSYRTILNYATGGKLSLGKKVLDIMKEEPASATQQRLKDVGKELNKQAPKKPAPPAKPVSAKAPIIGTGVAEGITNQEEP